MITKILLSTFGFLTLMNCQSQKMEKADISDNNPVKTNITTKNNQENSDNIIYLKEGENKFLKEQQMNVTFKGMVSDSRCPEGVKCVWAGAATALLEVMTTTSRPMQIQISTSDLAAQKLTKTQSLYGYNLTLINVSPHRKENLSKEEMKGKYIIGLKIEKGKPIGNMNAKTVTTE